MAPPRAGPGVAPTAQGHHQGVDHGVPPQHREPGDELQPPGHPARIDQRGEVVLDEPALVSALPGQGPEPVLQRSQRTDTAEQVHRGGPQHRGQMEPEEPALPQHEEPSEDREDDEEEMERQDETGQDTSPHR